MSPGATRLARIRRRAPSAATWRQRPTRAALAESYAGILLPGFRPATDPMNTIRTALWHQPERGPAETGNANGRRWRRSRPSPRASSPQARRPFRSPRSGQGRRSCPDLHRHLSTTSLTASGSDASPDEHDRPGSFSFDQIRRRPGRGLIEVEARDRGSLVARQAPRSPDRFRPGRPGRGSVASLRQRRARASKREDRTRDPVPRRSRGRRRGPGISQRGSPRSRRRVRRRDCLASSRRGGTDRPASVSRSAALCRRSWRAASTSRR